MIDSARLSFEQIAFQDLKDLARYIPERLRWAVHYFVTISCNSQLFL